MIEVVHPAPCYTPEGKVVKMLHLSLPRYVFYSLPLFGQQLKTSPSCMSPTGAWKGAQTVAPLHVWTFVLGVLFSALLHRLAHWYKVQKSLT